MDSQHRFGERGSRRRPPADDEGATQRDGGFDAEPAGPTVVGDAGGWPSFERAAGFPSRHAEAPPPDADDEGATMVMEMESPARKLPLAWLVAVEGPGASRGTIFTLKAESIIGRNSGDVRLAGDQGVSGQHARVRMELREDAPGEHLFVLYDLASRNGTYAGARDTYQDEASRTYRHELKDGDYLLIGETTLVFKQIE